MAITEFRSRAGPDGMLKLSVPIGAEYANREVRVIVEPMERGETLSPQDREEWVRFVAETAGSIRDPSFTSTET